MNLFGIDAPTQSGFAFPAPLTEKYRPSRIADFAGLDKVKRILQRFAENPRPMAFYFVGASGTGKTTMARALADEMSAEVHHIPSYECKLETLQRLAYTCHFVPMSGKRMHLVLVDEADCMSDAALKFMLSKIDGSDPCPDTVWIFTGNAEPNDPTGRFMSRCMKLEFSSYGMSAEATELLTRVWSSEVGSASEYKPNFARIVKDEQNNIRGALMRLESEILAA